MKYANVSCSQCGRSFGPGDHGFSHCQDHPGHVQDVYEWQIQLGELADKLKERVDNINHHYDDEQSILIWLKPHAAEIRRIIKELRTPWHIRSRSKKHG